MKSNKNQRQEVPMHVLCSRGGPRGGGTFQDDIWGSKYCGAQTLQIISQLTCGINKLSVRRSSVAIDNKIQILETSAHLPSKTNIIGPHKLDLQKHTTPYFLKVLEKIFNMIHNCF